MGARKKSQPGKGTPTQPRSGHPSTDFQLCITLRDVEPKVWRRILIPSNATLELLHDVLQVVMGWQDCHLHGFDIAGRRFGPEDGEVGAEEENDEHWPLADLVQPKSRFVYEYDFGDSWCHTIAVEKALPHEQGQPLISCVDGAGACPPEDCGGAPGYSDLLDALADKTHPEHAEMKVWVGGRFDPLAFDMRTVNRQLAQLSKRTHAR